MYGGSTKMNHLDKELGKFLLDTSIKDNNVTVYGSKQIATVQTSTMASVSEDYKLLKGEEKQGTVVSVYDSKKTTVRSPDSHLTINILESSSAEEQNKVVAQKQINVRNKSTYKLTARLPHGGDLSIEVVPSKESSGRFSKLREFVRPYAESSFSDREKNRVSTSFFSKVMGKTVNSTNFRRITPTAYKLKRTSELASSQYKSDNPDRVTSTFKNFRTEIQSSPGVNYVPVETHYKPRSYSRSYSRYNHIPLKNLPIRQKDPYRNQSNAKALSIFRIKKNKGLTRSKAYVSSRSFWPHMFDFSEPGISVQVTQQSVLAPSSKVRIPQIKLQKVDATGSKLTTNLRTPANKILVHPNSKPLYDETMFLPSFSKDLKNTASSEAGFPPGLVSSRDSSPLHVPSSVLKFLHSPEPSWIKEFGF